jgi:hypothetical protein
METAMCVRECDGEISKGVGAAHILVIKGTPTNHDVNYLSAVRAYFK